MRGSSDSAADQTAPDPPSFPHPSPQVFQAVHGDGAAPPPAGRAGLVLRLRQLRAVFRGVLDRAPELDGDPA